MEQGTSSLSNPKLLDRKIQLSEASELEWTILLSSERLIKSWHAIDASNWQLRQEMNRSYTWTICVFALWRIRLNMCSFIAHAFQMSIKHNWLRQTPEKTIGYLLLSLKRTHVDCTASCTKSYQTINLLMNWYLATKKISSAIWRPEQHSSIDGKEGSATCMARSAAYQMLCWLICNYVCPLVLP